MLVPIVIQTFNRVLYTQHVIASIKNNLLYRNKIIIVDNGSTDGTVEYLQLMLNLGHINHLILNSENKGIAEPKNQGLEVVKEWAKTEEIKYVMVTDNDIAFPLVRTQHQNGCKCALAHMVELMDNSPHIGMLGIDLQRDNAPGYQEWWWRLRQHPSNNPEFAEISIGFWGALLRFELFNELSFTCDSNYGKCDEACRNYIYMVKKQKIGLWKGVFDAQKKCTTPCLGCHIGWSEDQQKFPEYNLMKKLERAKAEKAWKEKDRKW